MKEDNFFIELQAEELEVNKTFKYYVGSENSKIDADMIKSKMVNLGFNDAFVVAFHKDVRISMKEALNLQQKNKKNE